MAGRPRILKKVYREEKLKAPITFQLLERILAYLLYKKPLNLELVSSIKDLFDNLSEESMSAFADRISRFHMIRHAIHAIMNMDLTDRDMITDYIISQDAGEENFAEIIVGLNDAYKNQDGLDDNIFSDTNVEYIAQRVNNLSQYSTIYKHKDQLGDLLQKVNSGDVGSLNAIAQDFSNLTQKINADIQKSEEVSIKQRSYIFGTEEHRKSLSKVIEDKKKPSAIVKTGVRELNAVLGGGFLSEKVYVFLGAPGTGKSVFLLNVLKWAVLCNPKMEAKNSALKPLVLMVTQENSISETDERFYSVAAPDVANNVPFEEHTAEDLYDIYAERGWADSNVTYAIEYRENKEISTRDLDLMIDSYAAKGYEVVMLIHDYIGRIRPSNPQYDLRIDLGEVVNDECVIAKKRKIPVVTVMQVNREAVAKIEEARDSGKNIEKCITAANIGESLMIYQNCDYCGAFIPYMNPTTGTKYLCFTKLKSRYRIKDERIFFGIPYEPNSISLETNLRSESHVITNIGDGLSEYNPAASSGKRMPSSRKRSPVPSSNTEESDNLGI